MGATLVHATATLSSSVSDGREALWATEMSLDPFLGSFGCMVEKIRGTQISY